MVSQHVRCKYRSNLLFSWGLKKWMREHTVFPKGTAGRRSVRVLEEGPQLPLNPSRIPLSEPGFASRAVPRRVKKKSVSVGQISHFLPRLALKVEACKASMLSWRQSLARTHTHTHAMVGQCLDV